MSQKIKKYFHLYIRRFIWNISRNSRKLIRATRYKIIWIKMCLRVRREWIFHFGNAIAAVCFNVSHFVWFQCDAGAAVEITATLDRRREERWRLHGPSFGCPQQSRGGRGTTGTRRESRSGPAEREPADRPASGGRATTHADRPGIFPRIPAKIPPMPFPIPE